MSRKSIVIIWFVLVSPASAMTPFSVEAWKEILPIYKAIVDHPFNQELVKGTLPSKVFDYYTEQDGLYLIDFTKTLALLASKLEESSDIEKVMKLVLESAAEGAASEKKRVKAAPATVFYANYLLTVAFSKSREELAAALLPCFWIYLKLADELKRYSPPSNPYLKWIQTYSAAKYRKSVELMIELVDKLAAATTPDTRGKMREAFATASRMEWYFWDGAYRMESWKP